MRVPAWPPGRPWPILFPHRVGFGRRRAAGTLALLLAASLTAAQVGEKPREVAAARAHLQAGQRALEANKPQQ